MIILAVINFLPNLNMFWESEMNQGIDGFQTIAICVRKSSSSQTQV